jgi:hypothetical protein
MAESKNDFLQIILSTDDPVIQELVERLNFILARLFDKLQDLQAQIDAL